MTTSGGGSGAIKFPVTSNGLQSNLAGSRNACLCILDPTKSGAASLVYSSFLGGDRDSQGHSVAVDPSGRYIAVGGFTTSSNFPTTTNAYRSKAPDGGFDPNSSNGFITQFHSSQPGSASSQYTMRYSTYLGGDSSTARDDVYGMTMTSSGLIVATGRTQSSDFPMTTAGPTIFNSAPYLKKAKSGDEPFLVKINPSSSGTASLVYSTFLGGGSASGQWGSWSTSVAVDARGAVYVGGETDAQGALYDPSSLTAPQTFPYTSNAFLQAPQGSEDALLMQINPAGDNLDYSTYLGGKLSDRTYGLAVDPDGNVVLTGLTFSSNFPAQNYPHNDGYQNAFVTKFSPLYTSSNLITDNGDTYTMTGDITYDNEYIGQNSTGTLIQGDFTNTVNNNLRLGQNAGASGAYNLSGGSLSVAGNEYIGYSGSGAFTQTGGTHTVTGILMLAARAGSSGTYSLSGGSLTVGSYEAVGYFGTGTFTQSGGTHTVTALYLGTDAEASGTYNLSGGSLSVGGNEYVGYFGTGSFAQTGGSHTVGSNLFVGTQGGTSSYTLSSGSLSVSNAESILHGSFTQTGGSHTVTGGLYVGDDQNGDGGSGTFLLSGGSLTADNVLVGGDAGTGSFIQSGGAHTATGALTVRGNGSGAYDLQNGTLLASTINLGAKGSFNQSGGTLNFTTFNQTGGTGTFSDLYLGRNAGSTSTYNLSGGTLTAINEYVGNSGSGTFTQSDGSNTVTNSLTLAANPRSLGTYYLGGGNLTVDTLTINPGGTFTQTGGTLSYSTLNLRGGSFIGDLVNTGLLTGTGPIIGKVTNAGTVSPGYSPGTLNIVGSYTQTAAGTYTPEVASAGSYDQISVTGAPGTAMLAGTIAPTLLNGYRPRGNQVFPGVVTTTGGITGAFNSILNQQISPTLFWQGRYNPTSVDLWVQRNYTNSGLSLNSNQQGVGAMLNSAASVSSGDLDNVLNTIDYLPDSASVRNAFKQISPEKAGSLTNLGFVAANFQMRHLATRTTNLRFIQGEGGSSITGGGLNFNYSKLDGIMLAFSGASLSNLFSSRKEFQPPESRWGLFLDGGAAFGTINSSSNQTGYSYTMGGLTLGADYRVRDNLLVGLATGYSNTSAGFYGSGGSVSTNTIPFNAYAAYFPGPLYIYGSLGYALNLYDLNRGIGFNGITRSASSSTTGNQLNLYGETGYDLKLKRFILTPSATLAYSGLWVGGFTESGAGALNLKVDPQSANSVQTGIGARVTVPLKVGAAKVAPQGYAFFQHEFADGSRNLSASLSQGSSTLTYQAAAAGRNYALVGGSITAKLHKRVYAQVNYSAEVGRGNATNQFVNIGLRFEF